MGMVMWVGNLLLGDHMLQSFMRQAVLIAGLITVGGGAYLSMAYILKIERYS
jgi:hypothetical protein